MMDGQTIVRQIIGFQKATFDNTFGAITMLQDQAEKATNMVLESSIWPLPDERKKVLSDWSPFSVSEPGLYFRMIPLQISAQFRIKKHHDI